jgi:hypothetical protein
VEDVMGIQKGPCQTVNWAFWILEVSVLKKRWKKNWAFHYTCEGSSFRPFWIFSPSTQPISLMMRALNQEGSKARPFSYAYNWVISQFYLG